MFTIQLAGVIQEYIRCSAPNGGDGDGGGGGARDQGLYRSCACACMSNRECRLIHVCACEPRITEIYKNIDRQTHKFYALATSNVARSEAT